MQERLIKPVNKGCYHYVKIRSIRGVKPMLKRKAYRELLNLIEKDGKVVPIEVKARNTASASLNNFIYDF